MRRTILVAAAVLLVGFGCKSPEAKEQGVEVTLDQVPPAVKETLARESGGAPMGTVHRETEKGKVTYEARVTRAGKTWEVEVDESGRVLEREEVGTEDKED
jgi:hypothetical protein